MPRSLAASPMARSPSLRASRATSELPERRSASVTEGPGSTLAPRTNGCTHRPKRIAARDRRRRAPRAASILDGSDPPVRSDPLDAESRRPPTDVGDRPAGLGDPEPAGPVRDCLAPAYVRHETNVNTQLFSFAKRECRSEWRHYASDDRRRRRRRRWGTPVREGFVGRRRPHPGAGIRPTRSWPTSTSITGHRAMPSPAHPAVGARSSSGSTRAMAHPARSRRRRCFGSSPRSCGGTARPGRAIVGCVMPFRRATSSAGQVRVMVGGGFTCGRDGPHSAVASVTALLTVRGSASNSTD